MSEFDEVPDALFGDTLLINHHSVRVQIHPTIDKYDGKAGCDELTQIRLVSAGGRHDEAVDPLLEQYVQVQSLLWRALIGVAKNEIIAMARCDVLGAPAPARVRRGRVFGARERELRGLRITSRPSATLSILPTCGQN
jgi:hypothetical protein